MKPDDEAERRMEAGRLLLRRLRALPPERRVPELCGQYRANALFLIRRRRTLSADVRARLIAMQSRLERTTRAVRPASRRDAALKLVLRFFSTLVRKSVPATG